MNDSNNNINSIPNGINTYLADRLLSIYSLMLILIGTPCNLICCLIYFQKSNRCNSIKIVFGYLAILDTIVLYTFNLNYIVREFNIDYQLVRYKDINSTKQSSDYSQNENLNINIIINKKNLEEYSLFMCRFLSYLAFSILQTSSWVLAFGSLNRYLLISKLTLFEFICKRSYTIVICLLITSLFFLTNIHILWLNGYHSIKGDVICYQNMNYPNYMLWYQRVHLCLYSALPSIVLLILNTLLMRIIFASKKRLNSHQRVVLLPEIETIENRQETLVLKTMRTPTMTSSSSSTRKLNKQSPGRSLNRHSRKLTLSLIFITLSYFILTFPSTVIFSFFRSYIEPLRLRRTISLLFTNLSTTTHAIRFFIYFSCSTDFRNDFYKLIPFKESFCIRYTKTTPQKQQDIHRNDKQVESLALRDRTRTIQ
ncbi:unnamed protein product [Adineta steineri]|uniref:G-protein coupled receptors family 1 profile domain-containing protein n=1 Tax=Adineta steineri TaxID=433720 RepID=A0A819Q5Y4_9BILA|nr:unnamed protein product [Adineta steineri]CAF1214893.1 unnamed protein product [Adineta steineri]CAF4021596.1 unnamed protein product [Adineta steineri]CAF4113179.1 unnamed protein product [Adineta steineri]